MKPDEANVTGLFATQIVQYSIPHYQRPQAWQEDKHWEPLWADIEAKANDWLGGIEPNKHYLGAIVLAKRPKPGVRGIDRYLVIDGQQRLSTLQYLLKALSLVTNEMGYQDGFLSIHKELFNSDEDMMDCVAIQRHKLWPTFRDREAHSKVMASKSAGELQQNFRGSFTQAGELFVNEKHPRPLHATWFFYKKIVKWIAKPSDQDSINKGLESMRKAITRSLQLIILWLEAQDDPQVIFECLNGRGEPLRPSDLIKNYVFMAAEGEDATRQEELTEESELFKKWSKFDEPVWMENVTRGRIAKARLEWLIYYTLQAETGDDLDGSRIYESYQKWAAPKSSGRILADEQVNTLLSYSESLQNFISENMSVPIGQFGKISQGLDVTTVSAVALAIAKYCDAPTQTQMYKAMASYLVRRETCGLTKKSYNIIFLALLKELRKNGFTLDVLNSYLGSLQGEASLWPDDARFHYSITTREIYGSGTALNLCRVLLTTVASQIGSSHASETQWSPDWSQLHVEHLLPQSWFEFWPLQDGTTSSLDEVNLAKHIPDDDTEAGNRRKLIKRRDQLKNTLGNLTILNQEINIQIKNHPWSVKQPAIREVTQLRMNFDLVSEPSWDESNIQVRGEKLAIILKALWPSYHTSQERAQVGQRLPDLDSQAA